MKEESYYKLKIAIQRRILFFLFLWIGAFTCFTILFLLKPTITLHSKDEITVFMGSEYSPSKATAASWLTNETKRIQIENHVDMNHTGTYDVVYSVPYLNGKIRKRQVVHVRDITKPTIELKGNEKVLLEMGKNYQEPGYTAWDNNDGNITDRVKVSDKVDSEKTGVYEVKYMVEDQSGNMTETSRVVTVVPAPNTNKSVIYLTFDDGPSSVTPEILDLLKKKEVKATFFMIGKGDAYNDVIRRVKNEGHTVAIHSNTHNYGEIYQSESAYFSDLNNLRNRLYQITGEYSNIIRFPGGSSNTVSSFNPGIMTRLTNEVEKKGYRYFDWNIDSGDTGRIGADAIYKNVTSALGKYHTYVVLMHDYEANRQTKDALEKIIDYGKSHGYQFDRITELTPPVHHGVNN